MSEPRRNEQIQIGRVLRLDRRSALDLLRDLARDGASLSDLRKLWARESGRTTSCFASDQEILSQLADRVASGSLVIARVPPPPPRGFPAGEASLSAAASGAAPPLVPPPPSLPVPAVPKPGLPSLADLLPAAIKAILELIETVQVEAVDVRVEIEQSMALIDMAQARFDLGTASLQEIPGSLDRAVTSMNEATSQALKALDAL